MRLYEIVILSVASGFVLSSMCLAFCRLGLDILGGLIFRNKTLSEFWTVALQAIVCFIIVTISVVPLYAIVRVRFDLVSIVLGGPLMATVGMLVFLVGGGYRWGKPPEYMWSVLGGFVVYTTAIHLAVGYFFG